MAYMAMNYSLREFHFLYGNSTSPSPSRSRRSQTRRLLSACITHPLLRSKGQHTGHVHIQIHPLHTIPDCFCESTESGELICTCKPLIQQSYFAYKCFFFFFFYSKIHFWITLDKEEGRLSHCLPFRLMKLPKNVPNIKRGSRTGVELSFTPWM